MSTALYRRYRPESFADVIGQEHVTEPLMQALRSGRVNHAYLFSGPRGCGKTTSARILARCLNCEQGPTPDPCGTCDSCVALARDGAGTVDVIEIDAASHNGVDDARDLRERAAFGPAQSRFKVYIIDEAHMVTPNGFNALLKIVEEPPPHVKFIFATTEPEKVIGTIRSRTHHYPFHLVPPQRLTSYLQQLCEQEDVQLEPGVLSFVTRAGGGSVRDSLSVLDQLISGSGAEGLTYERTAALLGFTDVELLDAVVDAVAAGDAATCFQQVDRVMESGHDPRRFVEDLLERYRDLIVLSAVGDQAAGGLLPGLPADQVERMRQQAAVQGPETLSRLADVVSHGLSEMAGAVSFRLMLELLVARMLLPGPSGEEGYGARLDRIERRLGAADGAATGPSRPQQQPSRQPADETSTQDRSASRRSEEPARQPAEQPQPPAAAPPATSTGAAVSGDPADAAPARPGSLDTSAVRRLWSDVLRRVKSISQRSWSGLQPVSVLDFDGDRLLLGMPDEKWMHFFMNGPYVEALRQALIEEIALDTRIEATVADGRAADGSSATDAAGRFPAHRSTDGQPQTDGPPTDGPPTDGPPADEPPADDEPPEEDAPPYDSAPAGLQPGAPAPSAPVLDDRPPVGQLRTRRGSTQPAQQAQPESRPASRPEAGAAGGTTDVAAPTPSMAEQLGAVRPSAQPQTPEWGRQAAGGAAPAWATEAAAERPTDSTADSSDTRQAPPSRHAASPTGGSPAAGSPTAGSPTGGSASGGSTSDATGDAPSDDDEDLATSGAVGQPVIESVLGGTVIAINDEPVG